MLDDVASYNKERWEELSREGVRYSQPWLDLTPAEALRRVGQAGIGLTAEGRDVLCLAASGGQQSAAFGLLGARVTVLDLSETQLRKDVDTARQYGCAVATCQGDMRDLSRFTEESFDIVWLAHGINFVPDARRVIAEASRVLRRKGLFHITCTNPFVHGLWDNWTGSGYLLKAPYVDGAEVIDADPWWTFSCDGVEKRVKGPREFRHSISTLVNAIVRNGMRILGFWESSAGNAAAAPGSWDHFQAHAPPWITMWARKEALSLPRQPGERGRAEALS